jgi:uncharacterized protein YbjT (DUF2867 family)
MKVILFGATGMVGQGVLRECLLDPEVEQIMVVGRRSTRRVEPKLYELILHDFDDYTRYEQTLAGYDACFFCLGVSSAGMKEADYRRVTFDYTLAAARVLAKVSPGMAFVYVSGMGTDSSEKGRSMWARVKGATENALLAVPFRRAYMFRPGFIRPMHGITSRTPMYRVLYALLRPLVPVVMALFPKAVTTTERVGRAMLRVVRDGGPSRVVESAEIDALGR